MVEEIDERVGVIAVYYKDKMPPLPRLIKWKDKLHEIKQVDLCHPVWEGKTLHHIFSVSDDTTYFRLDFNTRSQQWFLKEVSDGHTS